MTEISIVIPVFNNASFLNELTDRLLKTLNCYFQSYEIIFINDGSYDNSFDILKNLATATPSIKVINLSRNFGQHPAICAGFEHVSGDITVLMDADLQDSPEDIVKLIQKLRSENFDIVYTIKEPSPGKIKNRFTSTVYQYFIGHILNANVPINIRTFRAFNRKFLEAILLYKEANILYGPLMFFMGFKFSFLTLPYYERRNGKSSYTFRKRLKLAVDSLLSYTDIPHRLAISLGVILLFGSLLYGLTIATQYFLFGALLPDGITLILLVLCLTFGSLIMTLGIIGSYLFRVYQEVLCRPRYLVQEKINFSQVVD